MRFLIYTRVSKTKDNGVSHDMQIADCLKYVDGREHLIFRESDVAGDAEIEDRPVLLQAISELKKDDVLLVWKMDRLTRNVASLCFISGMVSKKNASLHSFLEPTYFQNNPDAEMMRTVVVALAQREVKTIRSRVKAAMQLKRSRGECVGHVPYGYVRVGKYLVPDALQQETIKFMVHLYEDEGLNYREVADRLNNEGILNREGLPWSKSAIHRCLTRRLEYAECYQARQVEELV